MHVFSVGACRSGAAVPCRLHVVLHGCRQLAQVLGEVFFRNVGVNEWADANRVASCLSGVVGLGARRRYTYLCGRAWRATDGMSTRGGQNSLALQDRQPPARLEQPSALWPWVGRFHSEAVRKGSGRLDKGGHEPTRGTAKQGFGGLARTHIRPAGLPMPTFRTPSELDFARVVRCMKR